MEWLFFSGLALLITVSYIKIVLLDAEVKSIGRAINKIRSHVEFLEKEVGRKEDAWY